MGVAKPVNTAVSLIKQGIKLLPPSFPGRRRDVVVADTLGGSVCGHCWKLYDEQLDDQEYRTDHDTEYEYLCPECYAVEVEGEPEDREWLRND